MDFLETDEQIADNERDNKFAPWAIILCLIVIGYLFGCATTPGEVLIAQANATPTPNLPPHITYVKDVHAQCIAVGTKFKQGERILGCSDAHGKLIPGRCAVILPVDDPGWIREHELLHCKYGRWH